MALRGIKNKTWTFTRKTGSVDDGRMGIKWERKVPKGGKERRERNRQCGNAILFIRISNKLYYW